MAKLDIYKTDSDLDFFSRMYIGQYDEIFWKHGFHSTYLNWNDDSEAYLAAKKIRDFFIPSIKDMDFRGSLGIWSQYTPEIAIKSYDIKQCLRFQIDVHRGTDYVSTPFLHATWDYDGEYRKWIDYAEKTLNKQLNGRYPMVARTWTCPFLIENIRDYEADVVIGDKEVAAILEKAAKVSKYADDCNLADMFAELYPNADMSSIADEIRVLSARLKNGCS